MAVLKEWNCYKDSIIYYFKHSGLSFMAFLVIDILHFYYHNNTYYYKYLGQSLGSDTY